ncbi:MAG: hypothetical protein AAF639_32575, partial [Chloroflexota bacterium]
MVLTRQQQADACNHIFETVFNQAPDSPFHKVFAGSLDPTFISTLADDDIALLSCKEAGADVPLNLHQRSLLKAFRNLVAHRTDAGNRVTDDDWTTFTRAEFDEFRISPHNRIPMTARAPPSLVHSATGTRPRDVVQDFCRGIKRDPASFTPLKDEKQWDNWRRHTVAAARAQDVSDVLDPNYTPSTPVDVELFAEKQKCLYSVLESNLLTDKGKALTRKYEKTFDAQKLYAELERHAQTSTKAAIDSGELLAYITSTRLDDGNWKGSTHSYVLHWQDQVRLYESLVDASDHFSDGQKRKMLENAVHPLADLRAVHDQATQHKVHSGVDLTYDQHSSLLHSAAQTYDSQFAAKPVSRASRRSVYVHDLLSSDLEPDPDPDIAFDIDSPVDVLQAYAAGSFRPRVCLSGDQWHRLTPKAQAIWDQLDDASKQIV